MPFRSRGPVLKLLGFFGLIGMGLLFLVHSNRVELVTPATPVTVIPDSSPPTVYQTPVYTPPNPGPIVIHPAPVIVVPTAPGYSNRDGDRSRDYHGHEEHGR
jgi:hypothetical protein